MSTSTCNTLAASVLNYITGEHLLPPPDRQEAAVLVALSGGADSVALLCVLKELGYRCAAAHCNFQLRGEESQRDEDFVSRLCQQRHVEFHCRRFDTKAYASSHGISIEMAARDLRYAYFAELLRSNGYACVAVAHHSDDNVETILLNMLRGTGIKGLAGIAPKRDNVIRPLLSVSRADIIAYLKAQEQDFVIDSSNLVADVKRNIVRLKLMPLLRELNPSAEATIIRNAAHLREVHEFVQSSCLLPLASRPDGSQSIATSSIASHLCLFETLSPYGFTPAQIDDIWRGLDGAPGAIYSSKDHELLRDRDCLVLRQKKQPEQSEHTSIVLSTLIEQKDCTISLGGTDIRLQLTDISDLAHIDRSRKAACLDASKIGDCIHLRHTATADRFIPFGMTGSKLVSDFLTDLKLSQFQKQEQLVLTNDQDILWVVGRRPDNRYRIIPGQTRQVLLCVITNDK